MNPYEVRSGAGEINEVDADPGEEPEVGCGILLVSVVLCGIGLVYVVSAITMLGQTVMVLSDGREQVKFVLANLFVCGAVGILFCASGVWFRRRRWILGCIALVAAVASPWLVAMVI